MKANHCFFSPVQDQKTRTALRSTNNQLSIPGAVLLFHPPNSNLLYKHLHSSVSSSLIRPKNAHLIHEATQIFLLADPNVVGASEERIASFSSWRCQMQTLQNHSSFGKAEFRKADVQLAYIFRKLGFLSLYNLGAVRTGNSTAQLNQLEM